MNTARAQESKSAKPSRPLVIGLLGGVGSGKSTVARALATEGALVLDADQEARAALSLPELRAPLRVLFGAGAFGADGAPDRAQIAARVFAEDGVQLRKALEGLIHPIVRRRLVERLDAARAAGEPEFAVLDVPLLLGGPFEALCDRWVFVDAPLEVRVERTVAHRQWDRDEVLRREAAQPKLADKRARADAVLPNEGDEAALRERARALLNAWRTNSPHSE